MTKLRFMGFIALLVVAASTVIDLLGQRATFWMRASGDGSHDGRDDGHDEGELDRAHERSRDVADTLLREQ